MLTKKDFLKLADAIRNHNRCIELGTLQRTKQFDQGHLDTLATFCKAQNINFSRDRWLTYINREESDNANL